MKVLFLVLSLISITTFNTSVALAQEVSTTTDNAFVAHTKVEYQMAVRYYLTAVDKKLDYEIGEATEIIVNFKDTNRHSRILITVNSFDKDSSTFDITATREDFRGNRSFNSENISTTFKHVVGEGSSVIKLRHLDPQSSGSFRIRLDF